MDGDLKVIARRSRKIKIAKHTVKILGPLTKWSCSH